MGGVTARRLLLAVPVALLAVAAPVALADERIVARPSNTFTNPNPSIDQGERLTFQNTDVARHDVTSRRRDDAGQPLFRSATIGQGREVEVEGAQFLTSGSYGFICSVHPFMTGMLTVTSAGTPLPRGNDTTAPGVRVAVARTSLSRVVRSGRLPVRTFVDEAATVALTASARVDGRSVTLARGSVSGAAGSTETASLRLTRAGRRALAGARRVAVILRGSAKDAAGNEGSAQSRRTLR